MKNILKFQGSIKKEVEFPAMKKKSHAILPSALVLHSEFPRYAIQLCGISRGEVLLSLEFWIFSGIAHLEAGLCICSEIS